MSLTNPQDVADAMHVDLSDLTTGQVRAATTDIAVLEGRISRRPSTATLIADVMDDVDSGRRTEVRFVVASAVARVLLNPRGLRQFSGAVDDGTESGTVDSSRSDGLLRITAEEWATLEGLVIDSEPQLPPSGQAFVIDLGRPVFS